MPQTMDAPLCDFEEIAVHSHGQRWQTAWHPPGDAPPGRRHGSLGICVTPDGSVVLVSADGLTWEFPAGRPEGNEGWEVTLRREVMEEACAVVTRARLLGFSRGRCVGGTEAGLVLVRSIWRADVALLDWRPTHEMAARRTVTAAEALSLVDAAVAPIWRRAFQEAGLDVSPPR